MSEKKERLTKGEQLSMEKTIYTWMLEGLSSKKIIVKLMEEYDYKTEANCYKIINKILKSFTDLQKSEIEECRAKYLELHNDLYQKSVANKDYKTANTILDSMTKLQGLNIQKVETKVVDGFEVEF